MLASFNGGPSGGAVVFAAVMAVVTGLLVGRWTRRPGVAVLAAAPIGALVCLVVLAVGNRPRDAAGFFLQFAVLFFCPAAAVVSGVTAAVTAWVARA